MRLFYQLRLGVVLLYVADVIAGDPCSDGTYPEGKLFLYADCSEYYNQCEHGTTLKRPCASGTVFDPDVGVCNHPTNVASCGESNGCNGHAHGDLYVPDDGCYTYFYQCSHGTEYKFNCPSGLIFDVSIDVCNWPSDVTGCGSGGDGCNGHGNGALYVDDEDGCYDFFYQCNWGSPVKQNCSPGTVFNPKFSVCDHPYNVPACSNDDGCHGHSHGDLYVLDNNCPPYFYQCVHGKQYQMPCPDGLIFDTEALVCNWPEDVQGCEGDGSEETTTHKSTTTTPYSSKDTTTHKSTTTAPSTHTTPPTTTTTAATEQDESGDCGGHANGDLYVPDDGCYPYFYQCSHGTEYKFNCPSGLVFDSSLDVCNWPSDVAVCGTGNDGCNGHANNDHYVDDEDGCYDFFYQCNWGTPVKKNCGPGTVFNPAISVCDYPYNVPACSNDDGCHGHSHGDIYILDNTCSPYFYQCVHGKEYQMPCPDGLVFDTETLVCNWPNEVQGCTGDSDIESTTSKSTTKKTTTIKSTTQKATTPTTQKTTTHKSTTGSTEVSTTRTTNAPEPEKKTYVGFVIDDTGSMKDEITAVKQWLSDCVEGSKFFCGHAPTGGWIVSTFNDPDSQLVTGPTTNSSHVIHAINSLQPHGGWDCPEMAMTGVQTALKAVPDDNDGCKIFFFSDATAKDFYKTYHTFKLFIKKRCVFIPILTSCCGQCLWPCLVVKSEFCEQHVFERTHAIRKKRSTDYSDRAETAYYQLAERTGGDIFIMPKPKSAKVMTTILKKSVTLGLCGTTVIAGRPGNEYLCEADCVAMKMCWDRSVSRCYCPDVNNCATELIETDKSRCRATRGKLLCNPNISQDYFADVVSCSSFFTCKWGKATHHQCDKGKVFTPMREDHCDTPENAPGPCGNGRPYPKIVL